MNKQKVKNLLERGKNFNKWGGKKSPKLHKYTFKLYNYAILQGLISGAGWDIDDDKIFQVGIENSWIFILIVVNLHSERCYFAF